MNYRSKVTQKEYHLKDVFFVASWKQFVLYMALGAEKDLADIYYDSGKQRNRMTFVFFKTPRTRELYQKWNNHELVEPK